MTLSLDTKHDTGSVSHAKPLDIVSDIHPYLTALISVRFSSFIQTLSFGILEEWLLLVMNLSTLTMPLVVLDMRHC